MELAAILKKVKQSGNYEFHSTYTIDQAHSNILKWIEDRLPKEKTEDDLRDITWAEVLSWNAYRNQALKNLGITPKGKEQQ